MATGTSHLTILAAGMMDEVASFLLPVIVSVAVSVVCVGDAGGVTRANGLGTGLYAARGLGTDEVGDRKSSGLTVGAA